MMLFIALFVTFSLCESNNNPNRPIVLWHGMGDTCCYSFSMGKVKAFLQQQIPNVYVFSIMVGSNIVEDEIEGFLGNVNNQVDSICQILKSDPNLQNGFNAVGFSQGGQFLRAYVERCNSPPVYNLITMGGQHQGVADIPKCISVNGTVCTLIEDLLDMGAYNRIAQDIVVQAQYFHDPMDMTGYLTMNKFLPDINNDNAINLRYKKNLISLNNLVLIEFAFDSIVVPRESSFFGYYKDGDLNTILLYNETKLYIEDRIGLKTLDKAGKLKFGSCPGDHMQFTLDWFNTNVVQPYLINSFKN